MKLVLKIGLPIIVLLLSVFAAKTIIANRPEPSIRPRFAKVPAVEASTLTLQQYPVVIRSQGTVLPTRSNTLVPEVNGSVTAVAPGFVVGGEFAAGEVLLQIDERDYAIALTQAQANLAQNEAFLEEESARGKQAKLEWNSLGRGKKASAITLRLPQLSAARANRDAAVAQMKRAELDLLRTRIIAPYKGKVLEKRVNEGQFVSRGSVLGEVYAIDSVDIRLPLTSRQLTYLELPDTGTVAPGLMANVELHATIGGVARQWTGKLVRAEGVDVATQQLHVIARVLNPFENGQAPLRVGQHVQALIAGSVLDDVFVLPRSALREDREVLLLNEKREVYRRDVTVAWADEQMAAVTEGLQEGDILVTTALSIVVDGTPVRATIDGVDPPPREGRKTKKQTPGSGTGQGVRRQ